MTPFEQIKRAADLTNLDGPRTPLAATAPVVRDFDPTVEKLSFTLPDEDADGVLHLRDLPDGDGVHVEVNGRRVVTLMGCVAQEIPDTCLTFEVARP